MFLIYMSCEDNLFSSKKVVFVVSLKQTKFNIEKIALQNKCTIWALSQLLSIRKNPRLMYLKSKTFFQY